MAVILTRDHLRSVNTFAFCLIYWNVCDLVWWALVYCSLTCTVMKLWGGQMTRVPWKELVMYLAVCASRRGWCKWLRCASVTPRWPHRWAIQVGWPRHRLNGAAPRQCVNRKAEWENQWGAGLNREKGKGLWHHMDIGRRPIGWCWPRW